MGTGRFPLLTVGLRLMPFIILVQSSATAEDDGEPLRRRLIYGIQDSSREKSLYFQENVFEDFGRELVMANSMSMCMSEPSLSNDK